MAKIIIKNLSLKIPLIGQSRLFQKKKDKDFTKQNIGSTKEVIGDTVYSKILDDLSFECKDGDNIISLATKELRDKHKGYEQIREKKIMTTKQQRYRIPPK